MAKEYGDEDDEDEEDEEDDIDEVPDLILSRPDFEDMMDEFLNDFELLGRKKRHGSLGRDGGSCRRDLSRGNQDKAVPLGFPSEVDDSVLDSIDNLDGHALLLHAEDF